MAPDPRPRHVVTRDELIEFTPQLGIRHRLLRRGAPAVALPAVDPLGHPLHHVLVIHVQLHPGGASEGLQPADDGGEFHAVVRRLPLTAEDLLRVRAVLHQHAQPPRPGFPLHAPSVHIRTGTCPEPFDPEPPDPAPPGPAPPEVASPTPPLMRVLPGPGRRSPARRWRGRTPARPRSRERREGRRRCPLRCSHPRFRGPFRWGSCPRSGGLPDRSFPPRPIRPRSRGTAPPRFSPAGAATHPGRSCSSTPSPRTRA